MGTLDPKINQISNTTLKRNWVRPDLKPFFKYKFLRNIERKKVHLGFGRSDSDMDPTKIRGSGSATLVHVIPNLDQTPPLSQTIVTIFDGNSEHVAHEGY